MNITVESAELHITSNYMNHSVSVSADFDEGNKDFVSTVTGLLLDVVLRTTFHPLVCSPTTFLLSSNAATRLTD